MPTTQQIQDAIQNAQAAGDMDAVQKLTAALPQADDAPQQGIGMQQQAPVPQVDRQKLSDAIYNAGAAGDQQAAHLLFGQLRAQGMTLAPQSQAFRQAEFQKINAQNVASQPWYQSALQGVGKAFVDTGRGIGQLVGAISPQDVAQDRQVDQALMDTTAGNIGYGVGVGAQLAIPVGDVVKGASLIGKGVGLAADIPRITEAGTALGRLATVGSIAGKGALVGGLQPVTDDESRTTNAIVGGLGNLAGEGIGRLIGAGVKGTVNLLSGGTARGIERKAANAILNAAANPDAVSEALNTAPLQVVPGSPTTLAGLTGDTGLAGLQRTLQSMSPDFNNQLTQLGMDSNAARTAYIRSMFGGADQAGIDAAAEARDAAAMPLLDKALAGRGVNTQAVINKGNAILAGMTGDKASQNVISNVLSNLSGLVPEADRMRAAKRILQQTLDASNKASGPDYIALKAARRAITSAQLRGAPIDDILNTIESLSARGSKASKALSDASDTLNKETVLNTDVASLYNTRKAIDNLLQGRSENSAAARGVTRQLIDLKAKLDDEIAKASPEFGEYLKTYSSMSKPVNQAQVGQHLLSKAAPVADAQGNPVLYPATTSRLLNDPDALVQSATGFPKASARNTLTQDQLTALNNLSEDLRRQNVINSGRAIGSNTAQNMFGAQTVQGQVGPMAAIAVTHNPLTAAGVAVVNAMRKQFGDKAAALARQAMLNPEQAVGLIQSLEPTAKEQFLRLIAPYASGVARGAGGAIGIQSVSNNQPAPAAVVHP